MRGKATESKGLVQTSSSNTGRDSNTVEVVEICLTVTDRKNAELLAPTGAVWTTKVGDYKKSYKYMQKRT